MTLTNQISAHFPGRALWSCISTIVKEKKLTVSVLIFLWPSAVHCSAVFMLSDKPSDPWMYHCCWTFIISLVPEAAAYTVCNTRLFWVWENVSYQPVPVIWVLVLQGDQSQVLSLVKKKSSVEPPLGVTVAVFLYRWYRRSDGFVHRSQHPHHIRAVWLCVRGQFPLYSHHT